MRSTDTHTHTQASKLSKLRSFVKIKIKTNIKTQSQTEILNRIKKRNKIEERV